VHQAAAEQRRTPARQTAVCGFGSTQLLLQEQEGHHITINGLCIQTKLCTQVQPEVLCWRFAACRASIASQQRHLRPLQLIPSRPLGHRVCSRASVGNSPQQKPLTACLLASWAALVSLRPWMSVSGVSLLVHCHWPAVCVLAAAPLLARIPRAAKNAHKGPKWGLACFTPNRDWLAVSKAASRPVSHLTPLLLLLACLSMRRV
jgi:hypothetical protein